MSTMNDLFREGVCSTALLAGLDAQLIAALSEILPGAAVRIEHPRILLTGTQTHPFLQNAALDALLAALDDRPDDVLHLNSVYRTVAQQMLLRHQDDACERILGAAPVGRSNHNGLAAIDVASDDLAAWRPILEARGWRPIGENDPVHFDFRERVADVRATSVLAFQRLHNRHRPGALLEEDGVFGPLTERALLEAPIEGF